MSETNKEDSARVYETVQNQAPTSVTNWNTQVPPFLQNVPPQLPTYSATPSGQVWAFPTAAPQWSVARVVAPNTDPSSPFYQTFLKSRPRALGIVIIFSAILEIALGIGLCFTALATTLFSGIPFWGPIFYIIGGSLTIAAHPKPNLCLVKGSLSLNIISCITSIIAVILNIIDLGTIYCNYFNSGGGYYHNEYNYRRCQKNIGGGYAVLSFLLIINFFLFCVCFSLSIFGCRSLSKVSSSCPQVYLIQNDVVVSMNPSTVPGTVPGTIPGFGEPISTGNLPPPPPYVLQEVKATPLP
ncbi:membrane-spanning 4-domains subfamily A member 4A-like [Dendropsophus ebraccatus]|uniref:membrane-spanning 4-domains subfamily A member 4A-like n=1 Tax=Dendropsophus ebraccatus TaxID=150705 RepID=UPI003831DFCE